MTSINQLPPLVSARPHSHEVIDVDLLEDEDILITGHRRSNPRQGRSNHLASSSPVSSAGNREVIVIDSDEEENTPEFPTRRPPGQRHRLISPPPPPIHPAYVPPMPPVPRNLAGYRPTVTRLPPIIHPNPEPFAFEAHLNQPPRRHHTPVLPPRGAAPSHHRPVMGFGGAILAMNRQNIQEAQRTQPHNPHRDSGSLPFSEARAHIADALRRYTSRRHFGQNHDLLEGFQLDDLAEFEGISDDFAFGSWFDPAEDHFYGFPKRSAREQMTWKSSYTHPDNPAPGFTFDFDVDNSTQELEHEQSIIILDRDDSLATAAGSTHSPTSTTSMVKASLACARCLDTLYQDAQETQGKNRKERRVWALRCGHMLDGKCIHTIMRPAAIPVATKVTEDRKGKGKALRPMNSEVMEDAEDQNVVLLPNAKGKGRATTMAEEEHTEALDSQGPAMEGNQIRSRLRPRHPPAGVGTTHTVFPPHPISPSPARPIRSLPRRRGGGRGRGTRKPTIEESFDWNCPVQGCGRAHRSIRMTGEEEWKMDEEKGAIALFV